MQIAVENTFAFLEKLQAWWASVADPVGRWLAGLNAKESTDVIIALFTVVLALATVQLARATNVLANDTRENSRLREIQNAISTANSITSKMKVAVGGVDRDGRLSPEAIEALNEVEAILNMRKLNLFNEAIVENYVGHSIAYGFASIARSIHTLRVELGDPKIYEEIERLALKIIPAPSGLIAGL